MKITFPDGSVKDFETGATGFNVAVSISEGLARNAAAFSMNGKMYDMASPLPGDCSIRILTFNDREGIDILRHSTAHVMSYAVTRTFPWCKTCNRARY